MATSKRRDVRYSIRFPVQLAHGHDSHALLTEDVSHGGIFLCTDSPPPLMQLVRVRLVLPVGDHALSMHGMTVHVVKPENAQGRIQGVGVQFYALAPEVRDAWDAFIHYVEQTCARSPDQTPLRLPRGLTPEPVRRRLERHTAVLKVAPPTLEALEELYQRDLSGGSLFVETKLELPASTRVVVHIAHPHHSQPFLLEAVVLHRESEPREGLGLEVVGVGPKMREEFRDFLRGGINIDSEVVVEDGAHDDAPETD